MTGGFELKPGGERSETLGVVALRREQLLARLSMAAHWQPCGRSAGPSALPSDAHAYAAKHEACHLTIFASTRILASKIVPYHGRPGERHGSSRLSSSGF